VERDALASLKQRLPSASPRASALREEGHARTGTRRASRPGPGNEPCRRSGAGLRHKHRRRETFAHVRLATSFTTAQDYAKL
jgi:hypothetical protein